MKTNTPTIYDAAYNEQLKDYTLTLLTFLDKHNYLSAGALATLLNNHLDDRGQLNVDLNTNPNATCCAKVKLGRVYKKCTEKATHGCLCLKHSKEANQEKKQLELEYIELNGRDYYYYPENRTVYTYENTPKRIGILDIETDAIIAI